MRIAAILKIFYFIAVILALANISSANSISSNNVIIGDNFFDARLFNSLADAVSSPKSIDKCIIVSNIQTVSNDLTISANRVLQVIKGGKIKVEKGATLTINGPFMAGMYQAFDSVGTVKFAGNYGIEVYPQWFGALGNGSNDDTSAIQSAIDSLFTNEEDVTGGIVKLPRGKYLITNTLIVDSKKDTHLDSITIQGVGKTSSKIICRMTSNNMNGIEFRASIYSAIKDLSISGAPNNGIIFKGPIYSQIKVDNVKSSKNGGAGFFFERGHTFQISNCFAKSNKGNGFHFAGYHTSVIATNNFADTNSGNGYYINDISYSSFTGCASDNNGLSGYYISCATGLLFTSCGAESNQRAGFSINATDEIDNNSAVIKGSKNIAFDTCVNHNNDRSRGGYGNSFSLNQFGRSILGPVLLKNCTEIKNISPYSVTGTGKMDIRIEDCTFLKLIVPRSMPLSVTPYIDLELMFTVVGFSPLTPGSV